MRWVLSLALAFSLVLQSGAVWAASDFDNPRLEALYQKWSKELQLPPLPEMPKLQMPDLPVFELPESLAPPNMGQIPHHPLPEIGKMPPLPALQLFATAGSFEERVKAMDRTLGPLPGGSLGLQVFTKAPDLPRLQTDELPVFQITLEKPEFYGSLNNLAKAYGITSTIDPFVLNQAFGQLFASKSKEILGQYSGLKVNLPPGLQNGNLFDPWQAFLAGNRPNTNMWHDLLEKDVFNSLTLPGSLLLPILGVGATMAGGAAISAVGKAAKTAYTGAKSLAQKILSKEGVKLGLKTAARFGLGALAAGTGVGALVGAGMLLWNAYDVYQLLRENPGP
ncbi:MAG: hypothetical protein KM310_10900 [Clostridiales bacterium]|nr:hypothetical protein [Clostridiales bacterium]